MKDFSDSLLERRKPSSISRTSSSKRNLAVFLGLADKIRIFLNVLIATNLVPVKFYS
jgi:hypothetical protein